MISDFFFTSYVIHFIFIIPIVAYLLDYTFRFRIKKWMHSGYLELPSTYHANKKGIVANKEMILSFSGEERLETLLYTATEEREEIKM